jgi:hypothetical protein
MSRRGLLLGVLLVSQAACVELSEFAPLRTLSFAAPVRVVPVSLPTGNAFVLVDLDGDGARDLVYGQTDHAVVVHLAGPRPGLSFGDPIPSDPTRTTSSVNDSLLARDLDGDGTPELIAPPVDAYRWSRTGRVLDPLSAITPSQGPSSRAVVGDPDGDRAVDVWYLSGGDGVPLDDPLGPRVNVLRWLGDRFAAAETRPGGDGFGLTTIALGDLDGDGVDDVVVAPESPASLNGQVVRIYWGGPGVLDYTTALGPFTLPNLPVIADLDSDGRADLVFTASLKGGPGVQVMRGLGGRMLAPPEALFPVPNPNTARVLVVDLDRDRRPEIIVQRPLDRVTQILKAPDGVHFSVAAEMPAIDVVGSPGADRGQTLAAIDVDQDGRIDLAFWTVDGLFVALNQSR